MLGLNISIRLVVCHEFITQNRCISVDIAVEHNRLIVALSLMEMANRYVHKHKIVSNAGHIGIVLMNVHIVLPQIPPELRFLHCILSSVKDVSRLFPAQKTLCVTRPEHKTHPCQPLQTTGASAALAHRRRNSLR